MEKKTVCEIDNTEKCPRCNTPLTWTGSSIYCTYCKYKEGCCG